MPGQRLLQLLSDEARGFGRFSAEGQDGHCDARSCVLNEDVLPERWVPESNSDITTAVAVHAEMIGCISMWTLR
jgi:hypothetical protein